LAGHLEEQWDSLVNRLSICLIKLRDLEDEIVWSHNPTGVYIAGTGYEAMFFSEPQDIVRKIQAPLKAKLFYWLSLSNKAPTWDILQRQAWSSYCVLCKSSEESLQRILSDCLFVKKYGKRPPLWLLFRVVGIMEWFHTS